MTFVAKNVCDIVLLTTIILVFRAEASSLIRGATQECNMSQLTKNPR